MGHALCEFFPSTLASANMTPPELRSFFHNSWSKFCHLRLESERRSHVDVLTNLDICPALTTFTFNADWRIKHTGALRNVTKRPHPYIITIGLHGLSYAIGIAVGSSVGAVAGEDWSPLLTQIRHRHNDLSMAALNKASFPKLQRIRALGQSMLNTLNKSDGRTEV